MSFLFQSVKKSCFIVIASTLFNAFFLTSCYKSNAPNVFGDLGDPADHEGTSSTTGGQESNNEVVINGCAPTGAVAVSLYVVVEGTTTLAEPQSEQAWETLILQRRAYVLGEVSEIVETEGSGANSVLSSGMEDNEDSCQNPFHSILSIQPQNFQRGAGKLVVEAVFANSHGAFRHMSVPQETSYFWLVFNNGGGSGGSLNCGGIPAAFCVNSHLNSLQSRNR